MIEKSQWIAATKSAAAGTNYIFVIKNTTTQQWFWVPSGFIIERKGTIAWGDLSQFEWPKDMLCPTLIR